MTDFVTFEELWDHYDNDPEFAAGLLKTEFSDQLASIMDAADIKNSDLADSVGCSRAYVTKILSGTTNFTLETMTKLAMAVGHRIHFRMLPESADWTHLSVTRPRRAVPYRDDATAQRIEYGNEESEALAS